MEIKIDTAKDSVEDIKKIISFLQNYVNQSSDNYETEPVSEGMFGIFDDDEDESPRVNEKNDPWDDGDDFEITPYG